MHRTLLVVAALVLAAGCGGAGAPGAARDPVQVLRADAPSTASEVRYWTTLRDALPNVTYAYDGPGGPSREQVSDSAVVGHVVEVEPVHGMLPEPLQAGDDVRTRVVGSDDPRAAWRVLSVTLEVSETLAGPPVDQLVLDWTLLGPSRGGDDVRAVEQALEDLGTLVVLSMAWPSGPEFVPGRGPLPHGYGIGRVTDEGMLDFPLIAAHEGPSAAAFQDGIDTLAELRTEVRKPARTVRVHPDAAP